MNRSQPRYSLTDLADLGGVTPRTVRYYISQGLLPSPFGAGPGPKYDDTDLARLRLIKRLQRDHQPLAEIRKVLDGLGDAEILQAEPDQDPAPTDSALDYLRRVSSPHAIREAPAPMYRAIPP
ncbi:MAG: MerR family transcriptional regulator, partial [Candidatus Limnocylindrales bacterium]